MTAREIVDSALRLVLRRKALLLFGFFMTVEVGIFYPGTVNLGPREPSITWSGPLTSKISMTGLLSPFPIRVTFFGKQVGPSPTVKKIGPFEVRVTPEQDRLRIDANLANKEPSEATRLISLVAVLAPLVIVLAFAGSVSEAALIEGVKQVSSGARFSIWSSARVGLTYFGKVLVLGVVFGALSTVTMAIAVAPLLLRNWVGIAAWFVSVVLALIAVPCLLTLNFMHSYSTRIAVLNGEGILVSIRKAKLFLHGRLKFSLKLFLWNILLQIILWAPALLLLGIGLLIVAVTVAIIHALLGGNVLVASPFSLMIMLIAPVSAFFAAFRSAVWTCAFLRVRAAG